MANFAWKCLHKVKNPFLLQGSLMWWNRRKSKPLLYMMLLAFNTSKAFKRVSNHGETKGIFKKIIALFPTKEKSYQFTPKPFPFPQTIPLMTEPLLEMVHGLALKTIHIWEKSKLSNQLLWQFFRSQWIWVECTLINECDFFLKPIFSLLTNGLVGKVLETCLFSVICLIIVCVMIYRSC